MASDSACREDHFQKKIVQTDLPFKFCKIGLKNTLFIFCRKWSFVCLFVCWFVCLFVATLFNFGLLFFKFLFKGKNVAVRRVRERGVNSILTTILRF